MEENTHRPQNPRRRRKTKWEIIKEAYLPTVILIITAILIIIFIAGALARRPDPSETTPSESTSTAPTADPYEAEMQRLLTEAALLAADYDYKGAADLLGTFKGDMTSYPALAAKRDEYLAADANMVTWSDPAQIKALSFHTLIADPARAFTNAAYGAAYKKNFVTTDEFQGILQHLYDNGYILVSLDDFSYAAEPGEETDGDICSAKELRLPVGKKPLLLVQTNVNYYTYMIDGNGDGLADQDGAGFASRMLVGEDGKITCEMVDSLGNTVQGAYDLVPILNDFIEGHPDFSYRGAKAILAPSGYDGIFGYRINAGVKASKGEAYYNEQVAGATELVEALRADGYELACYTYGNNAYGTISAGEIQTDLRSWASEITPVFGSTNILVFAQNSQIEEYTGSKFNVLHNAGFRYFLGFDTTGTVAPNYILQSRLLVTGSQMLSNPSTYSAFFPVDGVLDPLRGNAAN